MAVSNARRREQFEFERELRARILNSDKSERNRVTSEAYGELFSRFPDHDTFEATPQERRRIGVKQAGMFGPLARPGSRILGVGCGRGDALEALVHMGHTCVGVEPSEHMIDMMNKSGKFEAVFGTADRLDFPDGSFDMVFSQQVVEHLHPEDVADHLKESFRVLRPGGVMAVETPNVRTGPQDISRGFTAVAEGLHLKEWSYSELIEALWNVGFVRIGGILAPPFLARRSPLLYRLTMVPARVKGLEDKILAIVPGMRFRTLVGKVLGVEDVFLFGYKP